MRRIRAVVLAVLAPAPLAAARPAPFTVRSARPGALEEPMLGQPFAASLADSWTQSSEDPTVRKK